MDAVPVWDGEKIRVVEFRNIKAGDMIVTGRTEGASEGIYVHDDCWVREEEEEIKTLSHSDRPEAGETSFTQDYKELIELLKYEKETGGYVVWVLGPACSFDTEARRVMGEIISKGYCQALLAGNALATHDLEGGYLGTALGCDIVDQKQHFMGHYNHLDTINAINTYESIPAFIENEGIRSGIIYNCVKNDVPFRAQRIHKRRWTSAGGSRGQLCGTGHDTIPHTQSDCSNRHGYSSAHYSGRKHDSLLTESFRTERLDRYISTWWILPNSPPRESNWATEEDLERPQKGNSNQRAGFQKS